MRRLRSDEEERLLKQGPVEPAIGAGACQRDAMIDRLSRMRADGEAPGILIVGIDDMAVLNETYGWSVGDELIAAFETLASEHGGPAMAFGRMGGTTFWILVPQGSGRSAAALAQTLLNHMRSGTLATTVGPVNVSLSIGGLNGATFADLPPQDRVACAERALVEARRSGGDVAVISTKSDQSDESQRKTVEMASRIISALSGDRFVLAYQPIVDCVTGEVHCWECLARIRDGAGSLIPAASFIPVAEERGLTRRIDMRVLRQALADLARNPALSLSVNVSSAGMSHWDWLESYLGVVEAAGEPASRLMVELTEHARLEDVDRAAQFVRRLRGAGCTVAIDDFGAGYTSFGHLQTLWVDTVKIDGGFIRNLADHYENQVFARSLIGLAREIGLKTIAECVGQQEDAEILREMGADYLQGFLFGRPDLEPGWRQHGTPNRAGKTLFEAA
ncbi:MAG: EAL domain-containing protein [Alphaproteobacteria bacterium]